MTFYIKNEDTCFTHAHVVIMNTCQIYKYAYSMNANYPVYYLMLGHDFGRDQYYICTLTASNRGIMQFVGLHSICVHDDTWAVDDVQLLKKPLDTLQKCITKRIGFVDDTLLKFANKYMIKARLSEIRSSCAQRSIARAWRKCVSDPTYKVCIARLEREFNNMF
jgi:hypothetical protein